MKSDQKPRIFTFWEPRRAMPPYLELCLATWKKFLPDHQVVILDYENLDSWLGRDCFDQILYAYFSLPKQADAIRCAVLRRHGGIWFDLDTIITSDKVRDLLDQDSEFVLIEYHIGFIVARKDAYVLKKWEQGLNFRLRLYKFCRARGLKLRRLERWDYLGNSILNGLLRFRTVKEFKSFDRKKIKALPEVNFAAESQANPGSANRARVWESHRRLYWGARFTTHILYNSAVAIRGLASTLASRCARLLLAASPARAVRPGEIYRDFYFNRDLADYALENSGGLISLHNSWTPARYKNMSRAEFLSQDITLANIFKKLL